MATEFKRGDKVKILFNGDIVGSGEIMQTSPTQVIHGVPLPKGCCGVAVKKCTWSKPIPIPHKPSIEDNIENLQDAENYIIAWPLKNLVSTIILIFYA